MRGDGQSGGQVGASCSPERLLLGLGDGVVVASDLADDPGTYTGGADAVLDFADHLLGEVVDARPCEVCEVEVGLAVVTTSHDDLDSRGDGHLGQALRLSCVAAGELDQCPAAVALEVVELRDRDAGVVQHPVAAVLAHRVGEDVLVREGDP